MFTGSITENRITIGLQPYIREALYEDAKAEGITIQEYLRGILRAWFQQRQLERMPRR